MNDSTSIDGQVGMVAGERHEDRMIWVAWVPQDLPGGCIAQAPDGGSEHDAVARLRLIWSRHKQYRRDRGLPQPRSPRPCAMSVVWYDYTCFGGGVAA